MVGASASGVHVVKVGGSLLQLPGLALRLQRFLGREPRSHRILVVGGGQLVEQVRGWHRAQPIDEVAAHWMCIDLIGVTTRLLHARMPDLALVEDDRELLARLGQPGVTLFQPAGWLRHAEPKLPGIPLAQDWSVTSDSIAGRLATSVRADRLVLLKSAASPSPSTDLVALAAAGYIDTFLPRMAALLPPLELVDMSGATW